MLPFGSLAPGILLTILAFTYMLYFGVSALNKGVRGDENNPPDLSPEKTLIITEESSVLSDTSCHIYPRESAKPYAIWGSSDIPSVHKQNVFLIIRIPEIRIVYEFLRIFHFSRPPPESV
ncbi:MAG TPA: hypothetical protein DDW27_01180 [Bacteroidales bacterium]|nr:hypothetical protein [Bacteroidales bacterium]